MQGRSPRRGNGVSSLIKTLIPWIFLASACGGIVSGRGRNLPAVPAEEGNPSVSRRYTQPGSDSGGGPTGLPVPDGSKTVITLQVDGLSNQDGVWCFALFHGAAGFPGELEKAMIKQCLPITALPLEVKFEVLEDGQYAVAAFQDENKNEEIDTDLLGKPKEKLGFSNRARHHGEDAPSFSEAAFEVKGSIRHVISMY